MRASDGVDVSIEVLPRRFVKGVLLTLFFGSLVTRWAFDWDPFTAAINWYAHDKAAGINEALLTIAGIAS